VGQMSKILSYKNNRNSIVLSVSLIISIIITNSFIVFSPDENSRSYFSNLTSTVTVGIPMVIAFVMVFRYKGSIKNKSKGINLKCTQNTTGRSPAFMIIIKCICRFVFSWYCGLLLILFGPSSINNLRILRYKMYFGL
jgi:F0F1-type ATP synthase membrane subunit a